MTRLIPRLSGADRAAFIAAARSLMGAPFKHKGRDASGVDCVGLCVYALKQLGIECDDLANYSPDPDGVTLRQKVEQHLGPAIKQWRPGDIVLMRWHENARSRTVYCNHVGILGVAPYGPVWTLIHSHRETPRRGPENRVKEHALAGAWARRVVSVHSLTGESV